MKVVNVDFLTEGMVLAQPVYTPDGTVLVGKGVEVKQYIIDNLRKYGILELQVEEEQKFVQEFEDIRNDMAHWAQVTLHSRIITDMFVIDEQLAEKIIEVLKSVCSEDSTITYLTEIRVKDYRIFVHCVQVAVESLAVGSALVYSSDKLQLLARCALLHDIGRCVPPERYAHITTPAGAGSSDRHPLLGYSYLMMDDRISPYVALAALQHHEKHDGTGYPFGFADAQICEFAQIIAVTDMYDRSASDSFAQKAAEKIVKLSETYYNPHVVKAFAKLFRAG